mmetsp:Transcript_30098/g.59786  ORF Transcript_30098/g.59786 Transcript_30098/m.59786 type:complete len:245 (+) Transcript_30098:24-758(+)
MKFVSITDLEQAPFARLNELQHEPLLLLVVQGEFRRVSARLLEDVGAEDDRQSRLVHERHVLVLEQVHQEVDEVGNGGLVALHEVVEEGHRGLQVGAEVDRLQSAVVERVGYERILEASEPLLEQVARLDAGPESGARVHLVLVLEGVEGAQAVGLGVAEGRAPDDVGHHLVARRLDFLLEGYHVVRVAREAEDALGRARPQALGALDQTPHDLGHPRVEREQLQRVGLAQRVVGVVLVPEALF